MSRTKKFEFTLIELLVVAALIAVLVPWAAADGEPPTTKKAEMIDHAAIAGLEKDYGAAALAKSALLKRRAFKQVAQRGQALIDKKPMAPNRFSVLKVLLFVRKELVALRPGARSRSEFWATAKALLAAPDDYAHERLPAEIMLMRFEFNKDAVPKADQVSRIAKLVENYRKTSAEAESLIIASELLFDLRATRELDQIRRRMIQDFAMTPKVANFLRDRFRERSYSVRTSGTFKRADGREFTFPMDRVGHVYLSCFWSKDTPKLKEKLMSVEQLRLKYRGEFEVFSFNLDQLPDAGTSQLEQFGLGWHAMHLPKGFESPYFRCFGTDPNSLIRITNATGYLTITPIGSVNEGRGIATKDRQKIADLDEYYRINRENAQHLSRLISLRAGEFLVVDPFKPFECTRPPELDEQSTTSSQGGIPKEVLEEIQACFPRPPERYLLSMTESAKVYREVHSLCTAASKTYPEAANRWIVENRKIVALLGLWGVNGDSKHLQEAVDLSRKVLAESLPPGAEIVARYCLAKHALRNGSTAFDRTIPEFMEGLKKKDTARALGAACMLSVDAGLPALLDEYQAVLLKLHVEEESAWPITSFLLDKSVTGRLFRANFHGTELNSMPAGYGAGQMDTELLNRTLSMTFKTLDGKTVSLPSGDPNVFDAVVFLDFPKDEAAAKQHRDLLRYARGMVGKKDFNLRIAFISDDSEAVNAYMKSQKIELPVVTVPEGYRNPQILRLGIARANHQPNLLIVHHDGSIVWSMTGNNHLYQSGPALWTISRFAQQRRMDRALRLIHKGALDDAKTLLQGSPSSSMRHHWAAALACLDAAGPDDTQALETLNGFLKNHASYSKRYRYSAIAKHHYKEFERVALAAVLVSRARILEKQGKTAEAQKDVKRAESLISATPRQ